MVTLTDRVKARPLEYVRMVIDPFRWARWYTKYTRRRTEIQESRRISDLLNKMNKGSCHDTKTYRSHKLLQLLQYAGTHCAYYKNAFQQASLDARNLEGFDRLPLLDKSTIRRRWRDLISDEIDLMNFYTMNTGGSTGEPLEFLVSSAAGRIDRVHQEFVFRTTMQYQPGDIIVAFDGSPVPAELLDAHVYWVAKSDEDIPYGRLSYSSLYLREETVSYYVRHMLDTAPSILRGYPSFLNDIAEYISERGIVIPFNIKGVQLTAEDAYDWQMENVRRAFDTRVFLQYGHSEACVYAYTYDDTCEYYCSPFYGFTEVLGEDGRHVNTGEVGEVVVTGFHNRAMPFIRYRTGDLALFNGETDGIVRLGKIVGRAQDYVIAENGERVSLTALVFGQHYGAFKNIQKWQLVQDIPGRAKVRIVKGEGFSAEDEKEIRDKFKGICDIDAEFDYVDFIPLTTRGKFRFLVQNIRV